MFAVCRGAASRYPASSDILTRNDLGRTTRVVTLHEYTQSSSMTASRL
jgi:hypothetical protein